MTRLLALLIIALPVCARDLPDPEPLTVARWVDGDSGTLSDGTEFRLHGVDAAETGNRAKCDLERKISLSGKLRAKQITRDHSVLVAREHGVDQYGRRVVDLSVDGEDLGALGVSENWLRVWDYDGGQKKPDWCSSAASALPYSALRVHFSQQRPPGLELSSLPRTGGLLLSAL